MINLYRKYRPRKFSELIGQDEIKEILISELKNKKVSHAYLFTGMRGCGKTTTARILSKALNCTSPTASCEPCGKCDNCKAIDAGSFPDVIEMDAASNRGIDEIRSIKEGVGFVPAMGKYKIYIIDEVHMLTQQAFNALLKTLEEPPEHTVFILATTEINKVPQTIISRCQVLSFKPLSLNDVVDYLILISDKENFSYERAALEMIAKKGEGSMRDSIGILEQVAIFSSGSLTVKSVLELLGDVEEAVLDRYISAILSFDKYKVAKILDDIYMSGKNLEIFLKDLIYRLNEKIERDELIYKLLTFFVNSYRDMMYFFDKKIFLKAKTFELIDQITLQKVNDNSISREIIKTTTDKSNANDITSKVQNFSENTDVPIKHDLQKMKQHLSNANISKTKNADDNVDSKETTIKNDERNFAEDKIISNLPAEWYTALEKLKKKNIGLYTLISKASARYENNKIILIYSHKEKFSYETIISKINYVKEVLKKYGFKDELLVAKTDEFIENMPKEIQDIIKFFGGSVEKE